MLRSRRAAVVALTTATLFGVGCSDTGPGTGTVKVKLSNTSIAASVVGDEGTSALEAPLDLASVKSVDLFVVRVDARPLEPSDAEAAEDTEAEDAEDGGWVTLAEPNAVIDLMQFANGEAALLGQESIDAGLYRGFRIIIDPDQSSITLNDDTVIGGGSIVGLKFPSADKTGVKIVLTGPPLDLEDGEETTLLVKFDVSKSFVVRGASIEQNGLLFKPVIRAELVAEAPASQ